MTLILCGLVGSRSQDVSWQLVDPYAPARHEIVPQELPYGTSLSSFGSASIDWGQPLESRTVAPARLMMARSRASMPGAPPPPAPAQMGYGAPMGGPVSKSKVEAPLLDTRAMSVGSISAPAPMAKRRSRLGFLIAFLIGLFLFLAIATIVWFLFH